MIPLKEDLVLLIIQFLAEEGFEESCHSLERESGLFFNLSYFQDSIKRGEWETVEDYLNGFTDYYLDDESRRIFDMIRKCKYREALQKHEIAKAVSILRKELKMMAPFNAEDFEELGVRLALDEFREDDDIDAARAEASDALTASVWSITELCYRVEFPDVGSSRLWTLINHSLQWQHYLCENSEPMPDIESLLVDHACADQPSSSSSKIPPKLRWKKVKRLAEKDNGKKAMSSEPKPKRRVESERSKHAQVSSNCTLSFHEKRPHVEKVAELRLSMRAISRIAMLEMES